MQQESIKQSLLLWGKYKLDQDINKNNKDRLKRNLAIIEEYLEQAQVGNIKLNTQIQDGYSITYTEKNTEKVIIFKNRKSLK